MANSSLYGLLSLAVLAAVWSPVTGDTILAGGSVNYKYSNNVELFSNGEHTSLPVLPVGVAGSVIVAYGGKIHVCGGYNSGGGTMKCYTTDLTAPSPSWVTTVSSREIPSSMPIMVVGDDLWAMYFNLVIVIPFDGANSTEHTLPVGLSSPYNSCGGGDKSHRYIIPNNSADVWINTDDQSPGTWSKKATLGSKASYRACMITGTEIYVTGGKNSQLLATAERIDLGTYETHQFASMSFTRTMHAMGLIDGAVSVFGGFSGKSGQFTDTIETYDETNDEWTTLPDTLIGGNINQMGYISY